MFLISHDCTEKATLGKGLMLSGGRSWEAGIHVGEAEFSLFSQVFGGQRGENPHTELNALLEYCEKTLFLKHFA